MRKKSIVMLLIIFSFMSAGIFSLTLFATAKSENGVRPLEELELMDLTHKNFADKEAKALEVEPIESPIGQPAEIGYEYPFLVSDDYLGIDYLENFTVLLEGEHILILITTAAYNSFDGNYYYFANPLGDDSEPWLRTWDLISLAQLMYLKEQFDDNIYDRMAEVYGVPNSRPTDPLDPDYEEKDKIWTLLFNIRDDAYYDPEATSYIAGYFSLSDSNYYQKNIMHIDTYDWANRVGPGVARPYLYEGIFCHEYEHMIHADIDADEPSWVDEGLADLAAYFCGYGHMSGHIANYLVYHPFTSLTFWGGGLEDYGVSYLFQLYLYEKFGGESFTSALIAEPANGIEGIEKTLAAFGYTKTFNEIFDAWTIANYIDLPIKGSPYGYDTLDFGTIDTWGYTIEYVLSYFWWGPPDVAPFEIPSDWFGDPQPYTAQYYRFTNEKLSLLVLEGDKFAGIPPYSGTYEWYSSANVWAWRSFYQSFAIPLGGATLNFNTFFEIEEDWDYGYVEVYDRDAGEWYTLDAFGTVDYVAHGQDNPNCPAGREPTDYESAERWHAFTGSSGGWIPVSMDLSPFAGHTIDLYFTTWQDGAFTLQMMYVDDISIPEIDFSDDVEAGQDGWTTTGWFISDGKFANDWSLTLINTKGVPTERYPLDKHDNVIHGKLLSRRDMWVWDFTDTQIGFMLIGANPAKSGRINVAIISNQADHILNSHYVFSSALIRCGRH